MTASIEALYRENLTDEYGFDLPQLDFLLSDTADVLEDLDMIDPNDDYAISLIIHLASRAYKYGFDEGVDTGI